MFSVTPCNHCSSYPLQGAQPELTSYPLALIRCTQVEQLTDKVGGDPLDSRKVKAPLPRLDLEGVEVLAKEVERLALAEAQGVGAQVDLKLRVKFESGSSHFSFKS